MRKISTYGLMLLAGCILAVDASLVYDLLGIWAATLR